MARDYSDIAQKGAKGHSKPEVISNPEESKPKQRLDENGRNTSFLVPQNEYSKIEHVIAVMSGKGGVGKSMVTAALANSLADQGYRVGIMDADITGPSIPKMYGLTGPVDIMPITGERQLMMPEMTENGISVISLNVIMPDPEQAVIWRGPIIAGVVKQFWTDVVWGQLDYLLVDMPPGTGDVPLTVFQSLPVDGIMVVTSPQDLVKMIVKKAYNMAEEMKIPVLGVVENYSYMLCPHCGEKIEVFGKSQTAKAAADLGLPLVGQVPINPGYAEKADEGKFADVKVEYLDDAVKVLEKLPAKKNSSDSE